MAKRSEKKHKIRFEDDPGAGNQWGQSSGPDPWGHASNENNWGGQVDESGWGQADESGWDAEPEGGDFGRPEAGGGHWSTVETGRGGRGNAETGRGGWSNVPTGGWVNDVQRNGNAHGLGPGGPTAAADWNMQDAAQAISSHPKTLPKSNVHVDHRARTQQDQSTLLNSLLSHPTLTAQKTLLNRHQHQIPQPNPALNYQQPSHQQRMRHDQQYGATQNLPTWDNIPEEDEEDEDELEYTEEEEEGEDWNYVSPHDKPEQHRYVPRQSSSHSSPSSRTLHNALKSPEVGRFAPVEPDSRTHRFIQSRSTALLRAEKAFYAQDRKAKDRLHWSFSPDKDDRVRSSLQWIQKMSESVGAFGLQKFLQTRERGALFVNAADFRPYQEPAFEWMSIHQLKDTLDKILQESVALYDPATQAIVFVFLLSKTGNSMAIWRRKIPVAEAIRTRYREAIEETISNLKGDYPVYVDELPTTKQRRVLSKRKWWKPWSSKAEPQSS